MEPTRPHRFANRVGGEGGFKEEGPPVSSSTSAMPNVIGNNDDIEVGKLSLFIECRMYKETA